MKSGETREVGSITAFDFSLSSKRKLKAQTKHLVHAHSETLRSQFHRLRDRIDWDALRNATTENDVDRALASIDQFTRERLPNAAAILSTVRDPKYPKLRPVRFLAESCALALQTNPKNADQYSPRHSRDICYEERMRRGPQPKPISDLEFWRRQAELGMRVPVKFLRKINKEDGKVERIPANQKGGILTYVDIPEKIEDMNKRRTTVWLSEATLAKLKELSASTGAPMAELFRRAVERYLKKF